MGNLQSVDKGSFDKLQDEVDQMNWGMQMIQKEIHDNEQIIAEKDEAIKKLREQMNTRVVVAVLVGGGTLLLAYLIKKKFFTSEVVKGSDENSSLYPEPWRTIHPRATSISQMKDFYLRQIVDISHFQDAQLNILLLGQAGSGKSSFINTCRTALRQEGPISQIAAVLKGGSESVTKNLKAYPMTVKDGDGHKELPVRLIDCRGLLDEKRGVQTEDIITICDGHIKNNYLIQPGNPINSDDPHFRVSPGEMDKIHCVVYVLDAQNRMGNGFVLENVKKQFVKVREELGLRNIPRLILLTKIDRLGIKHIEKIFYDERVEKSCDEASSFLGFPQGDVLPQVNYCNDVIRNEVKDSITLFNIWTIIGKAKECVQNAS
ncbi:interferon-induced protein 44-like isoform X2 [Ostrea edulis]|uniref:interferon-induced protein 44-like isoform X2 n=1 Tax=Ostrea edulis TaxID=37623 RepID=UPI0024AEB47F|nr:interferon-induced protein 44-like isoform X2 [Ostrea edulis]XP_048740062.2 interferon-induced protein 44-like isoform X2 [Ostrea edulis]XP_055999325.1 interferon-induced protein 44-like isoform X2 [Ostrea edulis]